MTSYRHLLSPITIKGRTFRNRVFSSSHAPGYAEAGLPGERYQAYHEAKAAGGIGLTMFGGSSNVSRDSGSIFGQIYVGDDRVIPPFQALARRVHAHGAGLMCQITHMGRRTTWDGGDWLPTKGPSAIRDPAHHSMPYALNSREIARIVTAFADGARRCRDGHLDGVEILGSSHILGQFLSPLSNRRTDAYGGELENRARFLLEVLDAVRTAVGPEFLISLRTNFDESNEAGLTSQEGVELARLVARQGVADILNVNGAYGGTHMGLSEYMPAMSFPSAPYVELARRMREASGLATFQAARLSDPATADWAIGAGCLDMAGMTRPHMADPDIVAKLERGEEHRIRPCVGAGYCGDRIYVGRDTLCQHNVSTGREASMPSRIEPARERLRTVVVGGGPAGLEAARVLALRGHDVRLFEAGSRLGGQILLAARGGWRKDIIGIADWLSAEVSLLGVEVHLDTYADAASILAHIPDVVIVATGGAPDLDLAHGDSAGLTTVWDVLGGQAQARGETLVFDAVGGHAALSLADKLSSEGVSLVLATSDRHLGRAIGGNNVPLYLRNLGRASVPVKTDVALVGVERDGNRWKAHLRHAYTREIAVHVCDTVIADLGTRSVTEVFDSLAEGASNGGELDYEALATLKPQPSGANAAGRYRLYRIGDALAPRDIHAAILDANRLCRII